MPAFCCIVRMVENGKALDHGCKKEADGRDCSNPTGDGDPTLEVADEGTILSGGMFSSPVVLCTCNGGSAKQSNVDLKVLVVRTNIDAISAIEAATTKVPNVAMMKPYTTLAGPPLVYAPANRADVASHVQSVQEDIANTAKKFHSRCSSG